MKPNWKAVAAAVLLASLFTVGCGDTYRPVANPILQPGGDPSIFDMITSVNTNPVADEPGSVTEINVSGDTNVGNKPMGVGPTFGALDATGSVVFTVQPSQDNVTVTPLTSFTLTTITLLPGSHPVHIARGNAVMYTANTGSNTDCPTSGSVGVIDSNLLSVKKNICVGSDPEFVVFNGGSRNAFVLDKASNQVWMFDPVTNTTVLTPVTVGTSPVAAVFSTDASHLYVLNQGSHNISVLNAQTGVLEGAPVDVGATSPVRIALDSRLNRLYVVNQGSNSVSVFDVSAVTPVMLNGGTPVAVGAAPNSIAFNADASRAWVANTGTNTITEINTGNFVTRTIQVAPAGSLVTYVAASRDGDKVYASSIEPTNMKNGVAIVKTVDNSLVTPAPGYITIKPSQQDLNCNSSTTQCPLQQPFQLLSR